MNANHRQLDYPTDSFYLEIRDAIKEVAFNTQTPPALAGMEMLASMSAVAQGLYDVRLPYGKVSPVSVYCMIIAVSGERLTEVQKTIAKPLYEFDNARKQKHEELSEKNRLEFEKWSVVNKALRKKLTNAVLNGNETEEEEHEFMKSQLKKPVIPRARRILRQGITDRAIMDALEGEGESIAFLSDEASIIFKGGALKDLGTVNKAWDGTELLVLDRAKGVSVEARQPRLTISFKAQPSVFKDFIDRRGDSVRGSGHWARYLVGVPTSTQGSRYTISYDYDWSSMHLIHEIMRDLLREFGERVDAGLLSRKILDFSADANERWIVLSNQIEGMLGPYGYLSDIKDFASKAMEIAGRVAALLHIYSRQEGLISVDSLNRAVSIVEWHLEEFKRLFSKQDDLDQLQHDVDTLEKYLLRCASAMGVAYLPKNYVRQNGPLRPSSRLDLALSRLINAGRVRVTKWSNRILYIHLNTQVYATNYPVSVVQNPMPMTYPFSVNGGLSNVGGWS